MSAPTELAFSLSHYADTLTVEPYTVAQDGTRWDKPRGLWVSVDGPDDWAAWCHDENYDIGETRFVITLADDANVLILASARRVLEFAEEYAAPDAWRPGWAIDWVRVAAEYQGIVIAPYQWSLRSDERTRWYYGWDCASGCIWDAEAIAAVTP